jgi:hypothetical protein
MSRLCRMLLRIITARSEATGSDDRKCEMWMKSNFRVVRSTEEGL